jgi:adenylate cyclase
MTVIGDAVNFASRIESANRAYGTELLISEDAYRDIADRVIIGRRIEQAIIKGKSGHHLLYEVTGLKNEPHEPAG